VQRPPSGGTIREYASYPYNLYASTLRDKRYVVGIEFLKLEKKDTITETHLSYIDTDKHFQRSCGYYPKVI